MTHDDSSLDEPVVGSADRSPPNGAGAAFAAALDLGPLFRSWFRDTAAEAAHRYLIAYLMYRRMLDEQQEDELRRHYPRGSIDAAEIEARARAHGITFSVTAQLHHRAAILDYLDNPGAPTLISSKHLSWMAPTETADLDAHAENWRRYFALCQPLQRRDIAHDRALRSEFAGLPQRPAVEAAERLTAMPRSQPRRPVTAKASPCQDRAP